MKYAGLGRTGIEVSKLCLGTGMFGSLGNPDHDECIRMIHASLDAGINFIDTADFYSSGEAEEIVGKALVGRRDEVIVATKYFAPMPTDGDSRNRKGASRRWIVTEVENSLRRLGTDYIDLYLQHHFDPHTAIEETLSTLSDLIREGKIRVAGACNQPAERMVEAQWASERWGYERLRVEEAPYSLFRRGIERAVLPTARRYGMGVMVWGSLDGSWLSGRFQSKEDFGGSHRFQQVVNRYGTFDAEDPVNVRKLELLQSLEELAKVNELPLARLATAFPAEHPDVTSVIIGPRTMEQLLDLLGAADVTLSTELLDAFDDLLAPGSDVAGLELRSAAAPAELSASYRRGR